MKPAIEMPESSATLPTRSIVMGTAGHIDHGKTALVFALTGTDTDRLPEEKTRGITIDLGFASLTLNGPDGGDIDLSLVDVPGHHAFIRNMMAGAGGIDCVLLVVAADEGVKAQTAEHLAICSLLGVGYGVIALTKQDAVSPERLGQSRDQVRAFVQSTFLKNAPVIAVSARTREGLVELKQALYQLALNIPAHSTESILRLPLDRSFSMRGFGTVVTGTLHSGILHANAAVELQPKGRIVRVRGIQVHNKTVTETRAPGRVALNLTGIEVGEVGRGDTIVPPDSLSPISTVDVELTVLPGASPLKHRGKLGLHAFASETLATVLLYEAGDQAADGPRLARLRLSSPMLLLPGDRFVLRQRSPAEIIGGGRVIDAHPRPRLRKAEAREWLKSMQYASPEQQILARVRRRGIEGISLAALQQETGLNDEAIRRYTAAPLAARQLIGVKGERVDVDRFLQPDVLVAAAELLLNELMQSESRSISRAELQSKTRLEEWVFSLAVQRLVDTKPVRLIGTQLSMITNSSATGAQTDVLAKIEGLYQASGLASPLVSEVASTLRISPKDLPPLVTVLIRSGKLIRMGSDNLLIHADALAKIKADLVKHKGQTFDVGRFKTFTGLTRKHAIPVLEYLDGARVTLNRNGLRTVL
jgi:selenocysteine-specific elongation factor